MLGEAQDQSKIENGQLGRARLFWVGRWARYCGFQKFQSNAGNTSMAYCLVLTQINLHWSRYMRPTSTRAVGFLQKHSGLVKVIKPERTFENVRFGKLSASVWLNANSGHPAKTVDFKVN